MWAGKKILAGIAAAVVFSLMATPALAAKKNVFNCKKEVKEITRELDQAYGICPGMTAEEVEKIFAGNADWQIEKGENRLILTRVFPEGVTLQERISMPLWSGAVRRMEIAFMTDSKEMADKLYEDSRVSLNKAYGDLTDGKEERNTVQEKEQTKYIFAHTNWEKDNRHLRVTWSYRNPELVKDSSGNVYKTYYVEFERWPLDFLKMMDERVMKEEALKAAIQNGEVNPKDLKKKNKKSRRK